MSTANPKVRLKDIAEQANVSISTVSMSLGNHPNIRRETRERVQALSDKLGYARKSNAGRQPAAGVAPNPQTLRFGYLLVGNNLKDEAKMVFVQALTFCASDLGFRFEMAGIERNQDPQEAVDRALSFAQQLDGLVLSGLVSPELLARLQELDIPFVLIGHLTEEQELALPDNCELIAFDCGAMGKIAAEYLFNRGHQKIGFISEVAPKGMTHDRWLDGYQLACLRHNSTQDPKWVHIAGKAFVGGEPAAEAMSRLKDPPTAYIIPDVRTAAFFISAMRERGLEVPLDSLVLGGEREVARLYRLDSCPMLSVDMDNLARVGLSRLRELCNHAKNYACNITVPIVMHNITFK